jgi:hypothetical protein
MPYRHFVAQAHIIHGDLRQEQVRPLEHADALPTKGRRGRKEEHCSVTHPHKDLTWTCKLREAPEGAALELLQGVRICKGATGRVRMGANGKSTGLPEELPAAFSACEFSIRFGSLCFEQASRVRIRLSLRRDSCASGVCI